MAILADLSQGEIMQRYEAMVAENAKLTAALAAQSKRGISCKVSEKGAVSVYGLGRFPVTLYRSQWERLAGEMEAVKAFIEANAASLAVKE